MKSAEITECELLREKELFSYLPVCFLGEQTWYLTSQNTVCQLSFSVACHIILFVFLCYVSPCYKI